MNWWGYFALFTFSTVKFMFAPVSGPLFKLSFLETYFSSVVGAIVSSSFFFFSASYFIRRTHQKRVEKIERAKEMNIPLKPKKAFTRTNKIVVRIKRSIGIIGIAFWAPFFLSIPIGSIIVAKFYGKQKKAFPLVIVGILINGLITTSLVYLF